MSRRFQIGLSSALLAAVFTSGGCNSTPRNALKQSQLRAHQLYEQNRQLAMERNGLGMSQSQLAAEKARLEQQYLATKQSLDAANSRLAGLQDSNSQLEDRMKNIISNSSTNPLSDDATMRLKRLKEKYPEFEFDAQTGVSKFSTDLLFDSGSNEIRPEGFKVVQEFAEIMNRPDTQHLKVVVSGHTDDQPVVKTMTRERFQDNMGLSAHRALAVGRALRHSGIAESRMGGSFYGQHQPVENNTSDAARSKNRRVEIFVLAPDSSIAGWDPDPDMKLR